MDKYQAYFNKLNKANKRIKNIPIVIVDRKTKSIQAWFDWEFEPEIRIYKNHVREYRSIIQHEYCHYLQWFFGLPIEHDEQFNLFLKGLVKA